jgi:hypothetical protein
MQHLPLRSITGIEDAFLPASLTTGATLETDAPQRSIRGVKGVLTAANLDRMLLDQAADPSFDHGGLLLASCTTALVTWAFLIKSESEQALRRFRGTGFPCICNAGCLRETDAL